MMQKLTDNRMAWGRWALLCGVLLLAPALSLMLRPFVWVRLPNAVVTFDGRPTSLAAVYRSSDGELLVWITERHGGTPYVLVPSKQWGGQPNGSSLLNDNPDQGHWFVTERFVLSRDRHPRGISLASGYFDIDPHLVFKPGYIAFTQQVVSPGSSRWSSRRVGVQF